MGRLRIVIFAVFALLAVMPAQAFAAKMIARNATHVTLSVRTIEGQQVANVTFRTGGRIHHTLVWGARNAVPHPDMGKPQQLFKVNYSGGYGSAFQTGAWQKIVKHNECTKYQGKGPKVHMAVAGCAMPDGSFWLLQSWMGSELPDNGWMPKDGHADHELWISHWEGALPKFWLKADWIYGKQFDHVYGQLTYNGDPVYGGSSTGRGAPTDSFGRLVTIDTLQPPWKGGFKQAGGWYRYNSFLVHKQTGDFCDGIYPSIAGVKKRSVAGKGRAYRATVNGPGVTPVMYWQGPPPGHYTAGLGDLTPPKLTVGRGAYSWAKDNDLNQDQLALNGGKAVGCGRVHAAKQP